MRKIFKNVYYILLYIKDVPKNDFRHNQIDRTNRLKKATANRCIFGKYNYVAPNTGMYNVKMGSYCSIGPDSIFGGMEHTIDKVSMSPLLSESPDVPQTVIGNDVWVGANCVIRAGIHIGNGAVIGAHSFVNKDVPPYAIVVGSPARILRYRFPEIIITQIEESNYWDNAPEKAMKIIKEINIKQVK